MTEGLAPEVKVTRKKVKFLAVPKTLISNVDVGLIAVVVAVSVAEIPIFPATFSVIVEVTPTR